VFDLVILPVTERLTAPPYHTACSRVLESWN
jgi:hypothetical protein